MSKTKPTRTEEPPRGQNTAATPGRLEILCKLLGFDPMRLQYVMKFTQASRFRVADVVPLPDSSPEVEFIRALIIQRARACHVHDLVPRDEPPPPAPSPPAADTKAPTPTAEELAQARRRAAQKELEHQRRGDLIRQRLQRWPADFAVPRDIAIAAGMHNIPLIRADGSPIAIVGETKHDTHRRAMAANEKAIATRRADLEPVTTEAR